MKITDINGLEIEVTDLDGAIQQAGQFRELRHTDRRLAAFDREREAYWTDLHEKLIILRDQLK